MTNQWDSLENIPSDRRLEFGCGRIVARMPDLDDCQPIQRDLTSATSIQVFVTRLVGNWGFLSRFPKQAVGHDVPEPQQERPLEKRSNKPMFFSMLILLGIFCIVVGGVVLHKQHKKAKKEKAAAIALQKKAAAEAAEKAAAEKVAAEKAAAEKAAAEKAAAEKAAAEKAAIAKAAAEKAAAAKAAAEKAAAEKAAAEKVVAEKNVPGEIKPNATAANPQSPWDRPATEAYSPWGMASTRQMAAVAASPQAVPNVPPIAQPAIPTAPGTLGQRPQEMVSRQPYYNNYGTMVAPPMVAANTYRPYSAPVQGYPLPQNAVQNQGRIPVADSPLTYQNVTGMTASGYYVPSAVHELSQLQGGSPTPIQAVSPTPNAIRPLGPIPNAAPTRQGQTGSPMVAATGYPPQPPSANNYPPPPYSPPNYQPQPGYQLQPIYQPQSNYQPPTQGSQGRIY